MVPTRTAPHHHREPDDLGRTVEITEGILHRCKLRNSPARLKRICSDKADAGHQNDITTGSSQSRLQQTEPPDASAIPLGRLGVPQDIADLVRFLVGPRAGFISGQTIHVNGAEHCPF